MEGVAAAERAAPKKPALLKGGMILCWIYAGTLALFLAMYPSMEKMAASNSQLGVLLPGSAAFLEATRIFVVPLLLLSIVAAYGLAKDRAWSRWVMMLLLVLGIVLMPQQMANTTNYAISIAMAGFGGWYLYRKKNVVEYYRVLKSETANGGDGNRN